MSIGATANRAMIRVCGAALLAALVPGVLAAQAAAPVLPAAAPPAATLAPAPAQPLQAPASGGTALAPPPNAQDPNAQFSINQAVGDWIVRCGRIEVKSPAPCDVIQISVNKDNKQRISSFSLAYVPSRDAYAMQIVVPTGVALGKGLTLVAGARSMNGVKFSRCERDGCYVEMLVDNATIQALSTAGKTTNLTVVSYGKFNEIKLPVSLNGFPEAIDRMKSFSRDRAIALPPQPGEPAAAAAAKAPAKAPAKPAAKPAAR
jgi:invasion protein IalB